MKLVEVDCIDHIDFAVMDVDGYLKIFQILGFEIVSETAHHGRAYELKLPGKDYPIIEIHKLDDAFLPGIQHIGFQVNNVENACREMREQKIKFDDDAGIEKTKRYPHFVRATGRTIGNFRLPDGCKLQITDPKRKEWEKPVT